MPAECTDKNGNVVTLKEYIDLKDAALAELVELRFRYVREATEAAVNQMDHRLEGMNEFRESLKDQNANFLRRDEYAIEHSAVDRRVKALEITGAEIAGKASQTYATFTMVISIVSLLVAIALGIGHLRS